MYFNSDLELKMVEQGYGSFTLIERNNLIVYLANNNEIEYSKIDDAFILDHHKKLKIDLLNEKCENIILEGFTSSVNGHIYRTNRDDQLNMIGQKDELKEDSTITTVKWKTEDVGYIDHPREDWLAIYKEAFAFKKDTLFKYDAKKISIDNATTHDEVLAITWDSVEGTTTTTDTTGTTETTTTS